MEQRYFHTPFAMMFEFTHGPDVVDDLIQHWLLSHQIGPVSSTKTSQISPDLFLIFFSFSFLLTFF